LNSELQVATMLGALKQSTESPILVEEATKYLRGVRGDLVRRKKAKLEKEEKERARLVQQQSNVFSNGVGRAYISPYEIPNPNIPIPFLAAGAAEPRAGRRLSL
jgi:hypothetical protein